MVMPVYVEEVQEAMRQIKCKKAPVMMVLKQNFSQTLTYI